MKISFCGREIAISVKKVFWLGKFTGLMFRRNKTPNLLFEFGSEKNIAIHSVFVFFPFLAIWLNEKNSVLEFKIVKPFTLHIKPEQKFAKLVEVPLSVENREIVRLFVDKKERFK